MKSHVSALVLVLLLITGLFLNVAVFSWMYQDGTASDSTYESFGPRADKLLIKLYPSQELAWDALINKEVDVADSALTVDRYEQFTGLPLSDQINVAQNPDPRFYPLDINNNNNTYLGNPPDPAYPNPAYPNPCSVLGMRKAIAYLCNRTHIVNDLVSQYSLALPAYTCAPATSPYVHPDIAPGKSREDLCYLYSRTEANASLDASGFATLDAEGWRTWDATGERVVLKFFIRNDLNPLGQARLLVGNFIADELEACGIKVERTYGILSQARNQVMIQKNFHLYTGGWILTIDLSFLKLWHWDSYWQTEYAPLNYAGCNNPDFNVASRTAEYPANEAEAVEAGRTAQEAFAENVLSVPLFTPVSYTAMNRRYVGTPGTPDGEDSYEDQYWEGASPTLYDNLAGGIGVDNVFSSLNMHPQGFANGEGDMTIRYGFGTNVIYRLNPIYPDSATDMKALNLVGYESLLRSDPYNLSRLIPWIAKSYEIGTYYDFRYGLCSNISFSLRTDIKWSDGEPFTADDVRFTLVECPRILASRGLPRTYWAIEQRNITDFRIIDPYNFEIALNNTNYWSLKYIAQNWIIPEHVWRPICETGEPGEFQPDPNLVATGPWRIQEYVESDHILLSRNPNFFKKEPVDCTAKIQNTGIRGQVVPPGTDVEFTATIINQCHDVAASCEVEIYVDNELIDSSTEALDGQTQTVLGPFFTGPLELGPHEVKIVCTPQTPSWMVSLPSQYEMPIYATYREDVNSDYYVNVRDEVIVANAFASRIGDPLWNPKADIRPDYKIDMFDVFLALVRSKRLDLQAPEPTPGAARFVLDRDYAEFAADDEFDVTVSLRNVVDLAGYQFTLEYNTSTLDLTLATPNWLYDPSPVTYSNVSDNYSPPIGKYFCSCSRLPIAAPFTGNALIATLTFKATQDGSSFFNLTNTLLVDSSTQEIPHLISTDTSVTHDLAVSDVRLSKTVAAPGDIVNMQVDVQNLGNLLENAEVTVYADAEPTIVGDETVIGTQTVALPGPSSTTLYFSWDTTEATPGNLLISAKAKAVPGEINTANNLFKDGTIQILPVVHDVAVTDIRLLDTAIYAEDLARIEVDVQNEGNMDENVQVTGYADTDTEVIGDEVTIGTKTMLVRRFSTNTTTFIWDTLGLSGGDYTITMCAAPVAEEADVADNNLTDGIIRIFETVPCPDVEITCPTALTVNPAIFTYDAGFQARLINIGEVTIKSTGFEGGLRVVGSRNDTIRLCVNEADVDWYEFDLPLNGEVKVPLWLMFQPETHWEAYQGNYKLKLTVCGTHRRYLNIVGIDIDVCQNGVYIVRGDTVTFEWTLTGGSLVYLEAETDLPAGWTYSVDPAIGTFFETPQLVKVNITAPPDAIEGDMGTVTLRAYKNSTGTMIWQFVYFASTDNNPPVIEALEEPIMTPDGYLIFNATARDQTGIAETLLHYRIDGGTWENTTMECATGDTFGSTQYTKQQYFGTEPKTIEYYITVKDWFGNQTTSAAHEISIANDIAITRITANETYIPSGSNFTLAVTAKNQGTLPLSFVNIAVYANSTLIATQPIANLQEGASANLTFSIELPRGRYIITAFATCIPYESNTANNADSCMVTVAIPGDTNVDRKVDLKDVYAVAKAYGSYPGHVNWSIVCDINGDNKIDLKDYYVVCKNYGKTEP